MVDTIKPTVYLMKSDVSDADDIFKEPDKLTKTSSGDLLLYYKASPIHPPKWAGFVQSQFTVVPADIFKNASAYAVIVLKENNHFFAIPLGMGSHLIDMAKIEYNFGLKVAINCIPKDELRQLDLTTPEVNSQKTKKQSPKNSAPEEFGVNKEKDILRGVVGKLPKDKDTNGKKKNHLFGEKIEGKDSARLSCNVKTSDELKLICSGLLRYSEQTTYQKHYPWLDNMAIISDPILVDSLYSDLISAIKDGTLDNMQVAPPEFVDDLHAYEGFVFTGNSKRKKKCYTFPTMNDVVEDLGSERIQSLDKDALTKSCKVHLQTADGERRFGWPLSRCIFWETEKNGTEYVLSDGTWYKIAADFYTEVCQFFAKACTDINLPDMPSVLTKESEYNAYVCTKVQDLYLFDLGHENSKDKHFCKDKNEICDVYDVAGKRFIHVKMGKSSPSISHLLRQGVFSATALRRNIDEAQTKFRQHLLDYGCRDTGAEAPVPDPFTPSDYTAVFACVIGENLEKNIPFFSKVSFRDAALILADMGYIYRFGYVKKQAGTVVRTEEDDELNAETGT